MSGEEEDQEEGTASIIETVPIIEDGVVDDPDAPIPLEYLKNRVSLKTFLWLEEYEEQEKEWRKNNNSDELLEYSTSTAASGGGAAAIRRLFTENEEEEDGYNTRVQMWCSSKFLPDGIGGYCSSSMDQEGGGEEEDEERLNRKNTVEQGALSIPYILSESSGGHGDDLWAASRHISNLFADREKCFDLLSPILLDHHNKKDHHQQVLHQDTMEMDHHPLLGLDFIELGAGAGLPSWTAMRCGAKVVCTDQPIPNRIRCMAESAERNIRMMTKDNAAASGEEKEYKFAIQARVCPYSWGEPIHDMLLDVSTNVLEEKNGNEESKRFDVVVAADCIYMPQFHSSLLDSISMLMSDKGLALLPFALHGNVKDEDVWNIVDLAIAKGFKVETLASQQLSPQSINMDSKRGLIHLLRLTKTTTNSKES